jgi:hypothetical protein
VIHSLTANFGQFGFWILSVRALFISFFDERMFSRWIVTNITSARRNVALPHDSHSLRTVLTELSRLLIMVVVDILFYSITFILFINSLFREISGSHGGEYEDD